MFLRIKEFKLRSKIILKNPGKKCAYTIYLLVALVAKVPRKKNGEKKQIKSRGRKWLPLRSLQLSISMHADSMLGMLLAIIFTLDITTGIDATLLIIYSK